MSPAKKRRAYGSGSVTQRPDGYWMGRYDAGYTPSGNRRRPAVVRKTRAEAIRALEEKKRRVAAEALTGEHDDRATVKSAATKYLEQHAIEARPGTYTTNAGAIRKWVIPTIGHKRLTSLTPGDIRAIAKAVLDAGWSSTTAHQAQSTALTMLRWARAEGASVPERVIAPQKAGGVKLAPMATSDRDAIPEADAISLLMAAASEPQEAARWGLALLAAIRPGEACGLRWEDVDLDEQTITVQWQRQEIPYVDRRDKSKGFRVPLNHESIHLYGSYHLTRPKTKRGYRVVPLVDDVAAALRAWQAVAPENPWGLVFTDPNTREGQAGRVVRSKKADARHWIALQDAAQVAHVDGTQGRRYANYENRHTTATLLWMLGTPAPVIEQIAGHSAAVSRKHYAHVDRSQEREALVAVSKRLQLPGRVED